jgi:hypothetical protein
VLDDATTEMIRWREGVSQEQWDKAFLTDAEYEEKYGKQDATENKENNHE